MYKGTEIIFSLKYMIISEEKSGPIKRGLLEMVVLGIIRKEKVYAADILEKLKSTELATQEGTLYPMLSRLKREQFLGYEWVESEAGPPRKYYSLTRQGEEQLESLKKYWQELDKTINNLT
jgi:PadR family transcriptional regulator, regulatory protein PadR